MVTGNCSACKKRLHTRLSDSVSRNLNLLGVDFVGNDGKAKEGY